MRSGCKPALYPQSPVFAAADTANALGDVAGSGSLFSLVAIGVAGTSTAMETDASGMRTLPHAVKTNATEVTRRRSSRIRLKPGQRSRFSLWANKRQLSSVCIGGEP